MTFFERKNVMVTGGDGFIGSHLVERLVSLGAHVRVPIRNRVPRFLRQSEQIEIVNADLLEYSNALEVSRGQEIVFHLAAPVAGIGYNIQHPATMMTGVTQLSMNVLEAARVAGVERYQYVSSTCVYRRDAPVPTPESEGMFGDPEPSNFGYGWGKRLGEIHTALYAKEFGLKVSIVRPMNAYGPRDDFDPQTSHVIPALIRRVMESTGQIVVWGSGTQTRAFVFVEDLVDGMVSALETHVEPDPLNLGTRFEVTIRELVDAIIERSGRHNLAVVFDRTKPEGQPRKAADPSKAEELLGFRPKTSLSVGLERTIEWYTSNIREKIT